MMMKTLLRASTLLAVSLTCVSAWAQVQPWRNAGQTAEVRAEQLFNAMTLEQKIALVNAVDPAEYAPLAPLGIPAFKRVDASSGLRGDTGVTAFPVSLALGATFDADLARAYGKAIATEARAKGWNVILGPTVDVARDGLNGRLTESFGEDPLVNAVMGAHMAQQMQAQGVIAMAKHYTAYQSERDRLNMNVLVSVRALQEVYNMPFHFLIEKANIGSLMGSYSKVNGIYMLEHPELISLIKDAGFKGYMSTDFMGGADAVAQFNAGIDSWSLQPFMRQSAAFKDGRIAQARLDDAVRRTLWALFSTGTFDRPVSAVPVAIATTPQHQALATRAAESATVLLKNEDRVLPLKRTGQIAVIGPSGKDTVTGAMWSSYVDPGQFTLPIEAIAASAGKHATVVHAQGSLGDIVLPTFGLQEGMFAQRISLLTPSGKPGWQVQYFASDDFSGTLVSETVIKEIDTTGRPLTTLPDKWSARWAADYTPDQDGLVRLAVSLSGSAKVKVDGKVIIDGKRSTASNFPGGGSLSYPLQGALALQAGRKVRIEVEYSTKGAVIGTRMQLGWQGRSLIPAAVELARKSDVAVVFVNQVTGEEFDRDNYSLPADQDALIEAVSAVNPRTIVVLNTGGAVKMPWLSKVKGVVQMWYPGSAAGTGIANVLFGDADPGGRLPVTFPQDESQGPRPYAGGGQVSYDEGVMVGYKYFQKHGQKPLFPFGFGLSYTTFSLDKLTVAPLRAAATAASVTVRVRNTGQRAGAVVVQVYGGELPGAPETPKARLIGFAKLQLKQGEQRTVSIPVERRLLSWWDEKGRQWVTPQGKVKISVGLSSDQMALNGEMALSPFSYPLNR
jgi:beta-glucosidase